MRKPNLIKQLGFLLLISLFHGCTHTEPLLCPEGYKDIALTQTNWENEYKKNSKVGFSENQIFMEPKVAQVAQNTHASLVLSKFDIESVNFDIIVDYKNIVALRAVNPNPWEVFWLFFNYVPGPNLTKTTNYVIAKPNGFEVGRAAQEIDQAYVKTSEQGAATFNKWHRLRVQKQDGVVKFYFDENYILEASTSVLFTANGRIGLYSEDASVVIKRVCLK